MSMSGGIIEKTSGDGRVKVVQRERDLSEVC